MSADKVTGMGMTRLDTETDCNQECAANTHEAAAKSAISRPALSKRRWSSHDEDRLRMAWGIHSVAEIARSLDRKPTAVYIHADRLGLGLGVPQGFESVTEAARRAGYKHPQLMRILRWASVHIRPSATHPNHRGRRTQIVEPHDVDAAVAKWCALETSTDAARRVGCHLSVMGRLLGSAAARGALPATARVGRGGYWRVAPKDVDRLVAEAIAAGSKAFRNVNTEGEPT